ncbi:hypothetical protein PPGU19_057390 [Paraburkholderia sp. PGU19]|nr:hypothetical protein PPGU19_057390 [Paraburkholderia sp. PGU19]
MKCEQLQTRLWPEYTDASGMRMRIVLEINSKRIVDRGERRLEAIPVRESERRAACRALVRDRPVRQRRARQRT